MKGTTILSIILVTDHTHLTNFTGDKKMHTVYLSLGNISKDIHWKHNTHAWLLVTKIPISKFLKTQFSGTKTEWDAMPGILSHHLFHHQIMCNPWNFSCNMTIPSPIPNSAK